MSRVDYDSLPRQVMLREGNKNKEGNILRFGLQGRTENERINKVIDDNKWLDHTCFDNKMVNFPQWKSEQK